MAPPVRQTTQPHRTPPHAVNALSRPEIAATKSDELETPSSLTTLACSLQSMCPIASEPVRR
jgi:hypothetical protein